jgi:hypothetical protein
MDVKHFFVDCDVEDLDLAKEIAALDPNIAKVDSITRFLTLPIVIQRSNPKNKGLVLDLMPSIVLTLHK